MQKRDEICYRGSRPCMGSLLEITLYGNEVEQCSQALEAAFAEAQQLEGLLSPFKPNSELSRINRQASYGPVKADPEIISLIQQGLAFAQLTQGALDLTMGPLMRLWGLRGQKTLLTPPTTEQIRRVLECVGYQKVIVRPKHLTVEYQTESMEIEFGSMGKGYAIDRAIQILKSYGISRALVSFGSSTYALGSPPAEDGWCVAIRHPRNAGRVIDVVVLKDCAIGTSGDYEQGIWLEGQWYGHILDPRIGYPVTGTASTSVIARTAFEADAFSTAVFVLGPEAGLRLFETYSNVEGIIITEKKDGELVIAQTSGWENFLLKQRPLVARRQFLAALFAAVGWLMMDPWLGHAVMYMTREETLQKLIPLASTFREETVKLTFTQKEQAQRLLGNRIREETYTFWIGEKDGVPVGYALILDVIGKEQPITFMVAVNPEGKVLGVEVLVYRESQGSEIRSRRFMQQFIDRTIAAPLKLGRDIDSISGATLSSRSTAYAVKKALAMVEVVYRDRLRKPS